MQRNIVHTKHQLYERLCVSSLDFGLAQKFARHLVKKGWHSAPYERRGSVYMQQSAFTTSLVVSYARPFKNSYGWPAFPNEFIRYNIDQTALHEQLIELRDQVFAHSDSAKYSIRPWRVDSELVVDIEGAPFLRLSKIQCEEVVAMTTGIIHRLTPRLKELQAEIADGNETYQGTPTDGPASR